MHEIKCECFVVSSCHLFPHSYVLWGHRSALFIGVFASTLAETGTGALVPKLTFTEDC